MNKIDQYVSKLDDETRHAIVAEYAKYEATGSTGDTVLRQHGVKLMEFCGNTPPHYVTMYMQLLTSGVWKYYYMQQFGDLL